MDALTDQAIEKVVVMSSAQVGKTEILNNAAGFFIHHEPSPILILQPSLEMAEAWSKDRLAPMLRDSEAFKGLVKDPRSRDSGNTLLHKTFPGGHITVSGANSPSSLASRPIRVLLCDEVDRYPVSAGTEGDPVTLAEKRTETFWNRRIALFSTPTIKGASRIEMAWEQSDQRRFHVPCPHCDELQTLKWSQVHWPDGEPEKAYYVCEHCGAEITDGDKPQMLAAGKWIATHDFRGVAGFHLSELYSPWVKFSRMAKNFLAAKDSKETLKAWINTALGETFEEAGSGVEWEDLAAGNRTEDWGESAPDEVLVVTAGVDVQGDRIELELIGWGEGEESWSLQYHTIFGNPGEDEIWKELDKILLTEIPSKLGVKLHVAAACIDSGGHHTQQVYEFCAKRTMRKVYAVKGMSTAGRPLVGKFTKSNRWKVPLWPVGTDTAKELIYSRLELNSSGPGYCHFPKDRPEEWFKQLTAEKVVTRFHKGFPRREWIKTRPRNEALDCRVYGFAALKILNVNFTALAANIVKPPAPKLAKTERQQEAKSRREYIKSPSSDWFER